MANGSFLQNKGGYRNLKVYPLILSIITIPLLSSCDSGMSGGKFMFLAAIIIIIGGIIFWMVRFYRKSEAQTNAAARRLDLMRKAAYEKYTVSAEVPGFMGYYLFVADNPAREIIILSSPTESRHIPYSDIMGVEIVEDATRTHGRSTSDTVRNAILGNMFGGKGGMVVGALMSDVREDKEVSKVYVKLKIRDLSDPTIFLLCYDAWEATNHLYSSIKVSDGTYGPAYQRAMANAERIFDIIQIIKY